MNAEERQAIINAATDDMRRFAFGDALQDLVRRWSDVRHLAAPTYDAKIVQALDVLIAEAYDNY